MEIIERAARQLGNWSNLAKELGISRQQMSDIKRGIKPPTPYHLGKCAEIVGERWYDHALPALMAHEKTEEGKEFWKGKLERLVTTGAAVSLAAFSVLLFPNGVTKQPTNAIGTSYESPYSNKYYVKYKNQR